jgi:predicted RNase H-like HicB family nuclease
MVLPVGGIVQELTEKVSKISAPREFTVRVDGRPFRGRATPDLEVGGFSIEIPALPGCFSEADSLREVQREAREAIEAYLGAGVAVSANPKQASN